MRVCVSVSVHVDQVVTATDPQQGFPVSHAEEVG